MQSIVFFETTVLIAASIREIEHSPTPIEHAYYDSSKGLIRLAPKGKIIGIISYTVEEQAERRLDKALKDTIEECMGDRKLIDADYKTFSAILDKVGRNFKENVQCLDRLATSLEQVRDVKTREVLPMYGDLAGERPPIAWTYNPPLKTIAIQVTKLQWKRYLDGLRWKEIIPDEIDMEILSEAICIKRDRFSGFRFFLASIDKHFSGSPKEPWNQIPIKIEDQFQVLCNYPNEIIELVR